jgi:hypothetical protein
VLEGEIVIKTKGGEATLGPMDSVLISPHEGREILNKTNKPVTMVVISNY